MSKMGLAGLFWWCGLSWAAGSPGEGYLSQVRDVIDLWAWTGEFAAACTRRGKMPVFYQSYGIPGGRGRDEKYSGKKFHEDLQVKPIAAGVLGKAYLDKIEAILIRLERTQRPKIVQAGRWWRAAAKDEATTLVIGHMFPRHFQYPRAVQGGDFVSVEAWKDQEMIDAGHPKRFVLYVGYQYAPAKLVTQAGAMGVKLVFFDVQPARPAEPAPNILYINPGWPLADGCVSVPGHDVPILPASGVIDAAIYWAILAFR